MRQIISDETDGLDVLKGAMTATCSPDGQFVYTVSGRFTDRRRAPVFAIAFGKDGQVVAHEVIALAEE